MCPTNNGVIKKCLAYTLTPTSLHPWQRNTHSCMCSQLNPTSSHERRAVEETCLTFFSVLCCISNLHECSAMWNPDANRPDKTSFQRTEEEREEKTARARQEIKIRECEKMEARERTERTEREKVNCERERERGREREREQRERERERESERDWGERERLRGERARMSHKPHKFPWTSKQTHIISWVSGISIVSLGPGGAYASLEKEANWNGKGFQVIAHTSSPLALI